MIVYFLTQANVLHSVPLSGAYIRTGDGRIYAIRAANKLKGAEDLSTSQGKGRSLKWRGSEIMWSRPRIRSLQTGDLVAWCAVARRTL